MKNWRDWKMKAGPFARKAVITALVGCLASSAAFAADLPARVVTKAPAMLPVNTWTGFYMGVSLGARWANVDVTTLSAGGAPPIPNPTNTASLDSTGVRGGFYAGYNWQVAPMWLIGVEGDIADGSNKRTVNRLPGSGFPIGATDAVSVKETWDAGVRGRVGFLLTPSLLVFGAGGGSWTETELSATCSVFTCGAALGSSADKVRSGWAAGGGLEWAVTPNWLARVEYRHADYGSTNQTIFAGTASLSTISTKVTTDSAFAGIAYKF
jgi:outer membrane immunogenic protein